MSIGASLLLSAFQRDKMPSSRIPRPLTTGKKAMPKKINLYPFKIVTVALLALVVLLPGSTAWGQTNPVRHTVRVFWMVEDTFTPGTFYPDWRDCVCPGYELAYIDPNIPASWNGKYTSGGVSSGMPLGNAVTDNLYVADPSGNIPRPAIDPLAVDKFWNTYVYGDYDLVSSADPSQNCHGYSTGVGYWLNDFQTLMDYDYQTYGISNFLDKGAIFGTDAHSVKVCDVEDKWVNGERWFTILETHEKNRDSGVYKRTLYPPIQAGDMVEFRLRYLNAYPSSGYPTGYDAISVYLFYKKK